VARRRAFLPRKSRLDALARDPFASKTVIGIRHNCSRAPHAQAVNDELARLGDAQRLAKAGNYFLFTGGAADDWLDQTVGVWTISSMTLKKWIAEFQRVGEDTVAVLYEIEQYLRASNLDIHSARQYIYR